MATVEENFPRGGTVKTNKNKEVVQRPEVENLFQTNEQVEQRKRKIKDDGKQFKKPKTARETGALTLNKETKCVEILHGKHVKEGMLMLGCVTAVTDFEVMVGLPCGLHGFLSIANISDSYTKMLNEQLESPDTEEVCSLVQLFHPGMKLRCAVAKVDIAKGGSLSIQLSINPKLVNKGLTSSSLKTGMVLTGVLASVEDYGFIVDIGIEGTNAFMPKTAAEDVELKEGQYVACQLQSVKNDGRVVRLNYVSPSAAHACIEDGQGWDLTNLLPGLLLKATVKKVTKHGLLVRFLSSYSGQVDCLHMEPAEASSYAEGSEVRACVLYLEPSTRLVALSLLRHLVQPAATVEPCPAGPDRIGEVVKGCTMSAMHHNSGAMMELPDQSRAFVHRNQLFEPSEISNENRLLAMPEHTCRILTFSPMEQIYFVTLRQSTINKPFYRYHDISAGQIVEGTVSSIVPRGMLVRVSDHIQGLVPPQHLSDIILKNPEKKYAFGMKVKCRVLSVDPGKKRLYLTRKKTLIESTLPLLLNYSDVHPGCLSHGCIISMKPYGCLVQFYNSVKGLVPTSELSNELITNPEEVFYMGQVLKVRVINSDPEKEKMLLSCKMEGQDAKPQVACEVGKLLEVKVLKKVPSGLEVAVLPEEVCVSLPREHLSDHVSNCALLWESLQEGDIIPDLICCNKTKKQTLLTKKPAVRQLLEEGAVPTDFSEVTVGQQLTGWIKNILDYGVFVEFPHGLVGLSPKSAMSDKFIRDVHATFQRGQTVAAKITNLDEEKHRFLVSLKCSDVVWTESDAKARLLSGLSERNTAAELLAARDHSDTVQQLAALSVGQKLKLTVDSVTDGEVTFKSDDVDGATVQASKHHVKGVSLSPGQKATAIVLHVDILSKRVHVSTLPALLERKKTLSKGATHQAVVQHLDQDFAVVSLGDTGQLSVVLTSTHLNDIVLHESDKLAVGTVVAAEVLEPSCPELQGLPLVSWSRSAEQQKERPRQGRKGPCFGDVVQATVKSVKQTYVKVKLEDGSIGNVHMAEVMELSEITEGVIPTSRVKPGSTVTARVIGGRDIVSNRFLPFSHPKFTYKVPELTLLPSKLDKSVELKQVKADEKLKGYKVGEEVMCFVSKFNPGKKSLELTTDPCVFGTVELLAMMTNPNDGKHPEKLYKPGQAVRAKVVEAKQARLVLSLSGVFKLEKDSVCLGMVTSVHPQRGLLVKLPFGGAGSVDITDINDSYKQNPLDAYKKDELHRFYLIDGEKNKWKLSLRPSRLRQGEAKAAKDPEIMSLSKLTVGQTVRGYIKSVGEQGIFIRLSRDITGRAQLQKSTSYFVSSHTVLSDHLPPNRLLTTKIISIDEEEELVDLSLLSEDTGKPDVLPESLGLRLRLTGEEKIKYDEKKKKKKMKHGLSESEQNQAEAQVPKKKKKKKKSKGSGEGETEVYFREEQEDEEEVKEPKPTNGKPATQSSGGPARLQVAAGFSWDAGLSSLKPASAAQAEGSSDEEEQEGGGKPQKKSRHELEQEKKAAEKALVQRETELMVPTLRPKDAADFERLLLACPNSSILWLQYMAHNLQATQIDQARAVAERALKTISFREEQEKLNVWVALLNMENMYGTDDSLKKVFERALQFCEPMPVYQQLADIYTKSDKLKEAESLYKTMLKRFRENKAVWFSYGAFLLQQGQSDAASAVLQRALTSLPAKESVEVVSKFAQLEFRYGNVEKGTAMFDKLLTTYPKRTDLWSVFIDLMVKHASQKEVRALFDRVIHLSVSVKNIKFFFKRYLEYEKKSGTPQSIQAVKQKAMEFVESRGTEAAT